MKKYLLFTILVAVANMAMTAPKEKFYNNTNNPLYIKFKITSGNCHNSQSGSMHEVVQGTSISNTLSLIGNCSAQMSVYSDPKGGKLLAKETITLQPLDNIISHDVSECHKMMKCDDDLSDDNSKILLTLTNKNEFLPKLSVISSSGRPFYAQYDHISGDCKDNLSDYYYPVVMNDYILYNKSPECIYKINISSDSVGKNPICNATATIHVGSHYYDYRAIVVVSSDPDVCQSSVNTAMIQDGVLDIVK
jgi:hypothetical protein